MTAHQQQPDAQFTGKLASAFQRSRLGDGASLRELIQETSQRKIVAACIEGQRKADGGLGSLITLHDLMLRIGDCGDGIDFTELYEQLKDARRSEYCAHYIDRFPSDLHQKIADEIVENGQLNAVSYLCQNIQKTMLDQTAVARKIISEKKTSSNTRSR